jgi:hypothetical protein
VIDAAIALLQAQFPLERLHVHDHGLRFDREPPIRPPDDRVPRPKIALDRQGNLRAPAEARVYLRPQPREKSGLVRIPNRIASRVGPQPDVDADRSAETGKLLVRRTSTTTFGALNCGSRHPAGPTDVGAAQSGRLPPSNNVSPHPSVVLGRDASCPGDRSASVGHGSTSLPSLLRHPFDAQASLVPSKDRAHAGVCRAIWGSRSDALFAGRTSQRSRSPWFDGTGAERTPGPRGASR